MTIVRELISVLGFDVDMAGARRADTAFDSLKKKAGALIAATAVATFAINQLVRSSIDSIVPALALGRAVGSTAEEVLALRFAAGQASVSAGQLEDAIKRLSVGAAQAVRGNVELIATFNALGIQIRDSNGRVKSGTALFTEFARRVQASNGEVDTHAAALRILGEQGFELIPILERGGSQLAKNAAIFKEISPVTQESAKAIEDLKNSGLLFSASLGAIRDAFVIEFAPAVQMALEAVSEFIKANREGIIGTARRVGQALAFPIRKLKDLGDVIRENIRIITIFAFVAGAAGLITSLGGIGAAAAGAARAVALLIGTFVGGAVGIALIVGKLLILAGIIEEVFFVATGRTEDTLIGLLIKELQELAKVVESPALKLAFNTLSSFLLLVTGIVEGLGRLATLNPFDSSNPIGQLGDDLANPEIGFIDAVGNAVTAALRNVGDIEERVTGARTIFPTEGLERVESTFGGAPPGITVEQNNDITLNGENFGPGLLDTLNETLNLQGEELARTLRRAVPSTVR